METSKTKIDESWSTRIRELWRHFPGLTWFFGPIGVFHLVLGGLYWKVKEDWPWQSQVTPLGELVVLFILANSHIEGLKKRTLMVGLVLGILFFLWPGYDLIGDLDRALGGLPRKDLAFVQVDLWFFKAPVANFLSQIVNSLGQWRFVFYDLMMVAYMSFYVWVFMGLFCFWYKFKEESAHLLVSYAASFALFFTLNFTFYLVVPVT